MVSLFWWFPTFFFAVANMRAGLNLPQWNPRTVPSNAVHRPVAIPVARNTFDSKSIHWWRSSHFMSFFNLFFSYFRMLLFLYMRCASFVKHQTCLIAPCSSASADYLTMWLMFFAEGWTYSKWLQKQKEWNLCRHLGAHFGWDLRWGGMGQRLWRYIQRSKNMRIKTH